MADVDLRSPDEKLAEWPLDPERVSRADANTVKKELQAACFNERFAKKILEMASTGGFPNLHGSHLLYAIGATDDLPLGAPTFLEMEYSMPDIDIDFPQAKRQEVLRWLIRTYGKDRVKHIATVSVMKAKSALGEVGKNLGVPRFEIDAVTDTLIQVSSGDARYIKGVAVNTLETSETGKKLLEKHPGMILAGRVEGHSRHTGSHAAGMIVCPEPIINFGGINCKDETLMLDHVDAEKMGLLKIDCLGLTTLSVLEQCAEMAGFDFRQFYSLSFDDPRVFEIFRDIRLGGIFQFEGYALRNLCRNIKVSCFEDIVAITALARPGPLHGGAAQMFAEIHQGKAEVSYLFDHPLMTEITEATLGTIVYQEQLMRIMREIGHMSWKEVGAIRKTVAKKQGKEYFNKFKENFLKGTRQEEVEDEKAEEAWEAMLTFGAYGFNRSHAVAYGMVSYWTAWAKRFFPLEFTAANLNFYGPDVGVKILREAIREDGVKYVAYCPRRSQEQWTIQDGMLIGGMTNIKGIGQAAARKIIGKRNKGEALTEAEERKLETGENDYAILYPAHHHFGEYYRAGQATEIENVKGKGTHSFLGRLVKKNLRDLNEITNVQKRGGEIFTESTFLLNVTLEDDTDCVMGRVGRFQFEEMGKEIAEFGVEGEDWYHVTGDLIGDDIRFVFIKEITKLEIKA